MEPSFSWLSSVQMLPRESPGSVFTEGNGDNKDSFKRADKTLRFLRYLLFKFSQAKPSQNDGRPFATIHQRMDDPVVRRVVPVAAVFGVLRAFQHPAPEIAETLYVLLDFEGEIEAGAVVVIHELVPTVCGVQVTNDLARLHRMDLVPTDVAGIVDPVARDDHDSSST